jgi:predicted transcriptional regulator
MYNDNSLFLELKMSKSIMLSIQPQHFNNIAKGIKHFEYRKTIPSQIDKVFFYVSSPVKKVLAYVRQPEILHLEKEQLWQQTSHASGIEKVFLMNTLSKKKKHLPSLSKNW